jgi:hypothetical protein
MGMESVPETLEKFHNLKQLSAQTDFIEMITIMKNYLHASYIEKLHIRIFFLQLIHTAYMF